MVLEKSVDCDGTCSSLDTIGCELEYHEEVERQFKKSLKPSFSERYSGFMSNLQQNYPATYKVLRVLGF